MRIAVLGWGSLIWCPRELEFVHAADGGNTYRGWYMDGPALPVEFARVSGDGRLTLVINPDAMPVNVLWAVSAFDSLKEARTNLMKREGTVPEKIGYTDLSNGGGRSQFEEVRELAENWARGKDLDAVVWTDLESMSPHGDRHWKPGIEDVVGYLRKLYKDRLEASKEYIRNTPPQIQTHFLPALKDAIAEHTTEE